MTPTEVWSLILEESRKVINPQTFKTWLEPSEAVGMSEDRLLVSVKNQFAVDYIEGQYGSVLSRIAGALFDTDLAIAFQSDSAEQPETLGTRPIAPSDLAASALPVVERAAIADRRLHDALAKLAHRRLADSSQNNPAAAAALDAEIDAIVARLYRVSPAEIADERAAA